MERSLPQEPHPFPPPRPTPFSETVSRSVSPFPVRSSLPPLAFIFLSPPLQPPRSSPPLSSLPAPACPTPGKPLPSGSAAFISGFPSRGRQRLVAALLVRGRRAEGQATVAGARRPPPAPPAPPSRPPSGRPQPCGSRFQTHPRPTPRASAASSRDPAC